MKILEDFLTTIIKPKFIVTLIILTLLSAFAGVFGHQVSGKIPAYFEEWRLQSPKTFYIVSLLQLNRVYTSGWFLVLVFFILLSLGYSIYLQVRKNLRVSGPQFYNKSGGDGQYTVNFELPQDSIIKFMRRKKYKLIDDIKPSGFDKEDAGGRLIFIKNSFGRWGSTIFHSGLFLIIVAAVTGLALQKRGFVQVMEGEVFSGIHKDFLVRELGVFQKNFNTAFKSRLSEFRHEYWETDQVKSISSTIDLIDGKGSAYEETVTVNHPVKFMGVKIYQSFNYGYALSFIMKHQDGRETVTHFLLEHPDKKTKPFSGVSDFPGTAYVFKMKFYPDVSMNSFYPGNPILYLTVLKGAGEVVFDGLVIPGDAVSVDGNLLRFFQILPWSGLIYVTGTGMHIAYIGFFISCLGAAVIFLFPYKEISISREGSVLSLSGGTNRFRALFSEEINAIGEELKNTVN